MMNNKKQPPNYLTKFSFGSSSAIITNLALITGMDTSTNAKVSIIGSLLVIALADNMSDALGIHIFQESEGLKPKYTWISTLTNFLTRLLISSGFIFLMLIFPLKTAVLFSVIYGLMVLSIISYIIAVNRKISPWRSIIEHILIAVTVIVASHFFGGVIINKFKIS
jgi:VIT1/CCC1 family predicted Fe2+/Mn2+ transporter